MAERQTTTQKIAIGFETTPGTLVAATKYIQSYRVEPGVKLNFEQFTPVGYKAPTLINAGSEMTEAKISGKATYTEIETLLASVLCNPAVGSQIGTTGAYPTLFTPSASSPDVFKTLTIEQGDTVRGHRFGFGCVNSFGFKWDREKADIDGSMFGSKLDDGFTLTTLTSSDVYEIQPVLGSQIAVFADSTSGGLGTTKLTRALMGELSITDRYKPVWVVDSAQSSFVAVVEQVPKVELKLTLEADAAGMAFLTTARSSATKFLRVKAVGANIGVAADYTLQFDLAAKISAISEFKDADGLYAIEFTFTAVYDPTWGKFLEAKTINKIQTL
jgi:hypothetical protein